MTANSGPVAQRHFVRSSSSDLAKRREIPAVIQPVVWVVDDEPAVCSAIKRLLGASGYNVQVFLDTTHLVECGRPATPCCLILDVHMPEVDGVEFLERLNRAGIRIPTIFITGLGNVPMSVRAMKAGAVDFLPKPFAVDEMLRAVAGALAVDEEQLKLAKEAADLRQRYLRLTDREREVFRAVTKGLLNKQVGAQLGITEKTVKVHRARVVEKMEAESLAELVRMADVLGPHLSAVAALSPVNADVQADQGWAS